jgi:hypothetical protein
MKSKPSAPVFYRRSHPALNRIRFLSRLLDNAVRVPGTSFRVGFDPLLGLLPGAGDIASVLISVYIVLESLRFQLPKETLIRMISNLVTDTALGTIPIAGDMFDVVWKANARNLHLLETHLQNPNPSRAADRLFIVGVVIILLLLVVAVVAIALASLRALWWLVSGS